jgi:predicted enzyme related to lactoylglutathione lyase
MAKKAKKKTAKKASPKKKTAPKKAAPKKTVANPIVHWEIQAKDAGRQQQFYAEVFGWKIDSNNPMNYGMVSSGMGEGGINGGIGGGMPEAPARVTVYAQVKDINSVLQKVESLGGRTIMPREDIGPVIMALFSDPEGNVFGVIEG